MNSAAVVSSVLIGVPLLGALLCLAFWSNPDRLKFCSVAVAMATLGAAGLAGILTYLPENHLFFFALPLAALVSILGQPAHPLHRSSWVLTLVFLGLGLGFLTQRGLTGASFLIAIVGLTAGLLYRHHSPLWPMSWWGIGAYSVAVVMAGVTALAEPPLSAIASLLGGAVLLPLMPLHAGYLAALTRLRGNLPPFLATLLPIAGLHSLARSIAVVPEFVAVGLSVLALISAVYGTMKALAQSRVRLRFAYGSLSFYSLMWWFAATTRSVEPGALVFVGAVALVTCGLLIAWQVVRTRYGDDVDPQSISGLAAGMPQYAVLFSLMSLAAIGLPPFGVFAGFVGLLLSPALSFSFALSIILAVWLAASWYILDMVQRLLFGSPRSDLRHTDLVQAERASLILVVLALLALGVLPTYFFGVGTETTTTSTEIGLASWKK